MYSIFPGVFIRSCCSRDSALPCYSRCSSACSARFTFSDSGRSRSCDMNKGKKGDLLPPVLAERGTQDPSDLQTMGGARSTCAVGVSQAALLGLEEGR